MPIYNHPPDIYLNDVEYFELLSPKNIASRDLMRLARRRGYIFSDKSKSEDVRDLLTSYPSSWLTVTNVLDRINKPEAEDQQTTVLASGCSSDTDVLKIINAVKASRADARGEIYSIHKDKTIDGTYNVHIAYTEIDLSRSLVYQRRAKTSVIEVSKTGGDIALRFSANDRTREIVAEIEKSIKPAQNASVKKREISLRGVVDAADRTLFFTELIKSVEGYKFINTSHIGVDCRFPEQEDGGESNAADEEPKKADKAEKAEKELKGLVNRVALSGEQVLVSDLYQQARKTGYYIFSIRWTTQARSDAREEVELEAGFENAILAETFKYEVVKKRVISPKTGELETVVLSPKERRAFLLKIESAAFDSYDKLQAKSKTKSKSKE